MKKIKLLMPCIFMFICLLALISCDNQNDVDVASILDIPSISATDVKKVRKEIGYIGVAPGSLTDIKYSTDENDINNILSILKMSAHEETGNQLEVSGGGYTRYSIITESEKYDILISNGYISVGEKHYKFMGDHIQLEHTNLETHSFITYVDSFDAYTPEDKKIGSFKGLSSFEFSERSKENLPDNENLGYLETEIGKLYVYSENIFYIEENNAYRYYTITGESNLKDFFM